jgi:hypothetical protein
MIPGSALATWVRGLTVLGTCTSGYEPLDRQAHLLLHGRPDAVMAGSARFGMTKP